MKSDPISQAPKRRFSFVRVLTILVILATGALLFLGEKRRELVSVYSQSSGDPQTALAACDDLLNWKDWEPSSRSLVYRHKMRVYLSQGDRTAALEEVELAITADPESQVPW
ncbi:hypothetical protein [Ruegeria sp. Ofav3-42]|uniref:hypothetical protein n=1 Tax=Ruegeria sp. Ofav3-42 TaxID=2917759 RepID=UPI001EF67301|nr:hypothetical protein [Ruegeria sp. Ofav3-42]MCG7522675.1 hypothetical protein [Ruegeria sp. Ofav3-42]